MGKVEVKTMKKRYCFIVFILLLVTVFIYAGCEGISFDLTDEANCDEIIIAFGDYDGSNYLKTVRAYDRILDRWNIKSEMPNLRDATPMKINKNIYFIGGYIYQNNTGEITETDKVEVYNIEKDVWKTKHNKQCLLDATPCVANGKILFIGGYILDANTQTSTYYKTVAEYDPSLDSWSTRQDMPILKVGFNLKVINNKIYLIGGSIIDVNGAYISDSSSIDIYDPINNTWSQIPASNPYINSEIFILKDRIFSIGGGDVTFEGIGYSFTGSSQFEECITAFTPASWIVRSSLLTPRFFGTSCVINGLIYTLGGIKSATFESGYAKTMVLNRSLEEYNPSTDSWTKKADFPSSRGLLRGEIVEVDGLIYAIGGRDFTNPSSPVFISAMDVYNPSTNTWEKKSGIKTEGVKILVLK